MFKNKAFTLVEVILTLVIIGVIATITVPQLMNNINDYQYKSALKKTYTSFSQAFKLIYGNHFYDDYRDWDYKHDNDFTKEVYYNLNNYMNIIKVCGRKYDNNECFAPAKDKKGNPATFFTDKGFAGNFAHLYTFTLSDGTSVALDIWYKSSVERLASVNKNLIVESDNLVILVDVNGVKGPNKVSKDVHFFVLTNDGLVPGGQDNKNKICDGYSCTAKMLLKL